MALETQGVNYVLKATDQSTPVFRNVQTGMDRLASSYRQLFGALGAGLSAGAFVSWIKGGIDMMESLHDMAMQTGLTVETLSALRNVGKLAGMEMSEVGAMVNKLSKNMTEFAQSGAGPAKDAFKQLGLTQAQVQAGLRDMDTFLPQFAQRLVSVGVGGETAGLAMQLLGKSGAQALPFLHELAEQGKLIAAVTAEATKQADAFKDNLEKIGIASEKFKIAVIGNILPQLVAITNEFLRAQKDGGTFAGMIAAWRQLTTGDDMLKSQEELTELYKKRSIISKDIAQYEKASESAEGNRLGLLKSTIIGLKKDLELIDKRISDLIVFRSRDIELPDGKKLPPNQPLPKLGPTDAELARRKREALHIATLEIQGEEDFNERKMKEAKELNDYLDGLRTDQEKANKDLLAKGLADYAAYVAAIQEKADEEARMLADLNKKAAMEATEFWRSVWGSVEQQGKAAFVAVFSQGKGAFEAIGRAIKTSVIDLLYELTAKKWIIQVGTSIAGSLGIPTVANAAPGGAMGGLNLLGMAGGAQTLADFGNFFGSIGSVAESGASFGVMEALSGFAMANPWTAAAIAAIAVLGASELFGGGGPKQQEVMWDVANRGVGNANITSQDPAFYAAAAAFSNQIRASYTAEQIGSVNLAGISASGTPGSDPMQLLEKVKAGVVAALTGLQTVAEAEQLLAAQRQIETSLMEAQGKAAEALTARREAELATMDEALHPLMRQVYAAVDLAQRRQLEIRLMEAQGNATGALAARREDELRALDATLRPLQLMINAAEDLAAAFTKAQAVTVGAVNEQIEAAQGWMDAARQSADSWSRLTASFADAAAQLRGGTLSPLTPEQKYSEATITAQEISQQAMRGDAGAAAKLPQAITDWLNASRAMNASSAAFTKDFERAIEMLRLAGEKSALYAAGAGGEVEQWREQLATLEALRVEVEAAGAAQTTLLEEISRKLGGGASGDAGGLLKELLYQNYMQRYEAKTHELWPSSGTIAAFDAAFGEWLRDNPIPSHAAGMPYVPRDDYLMRADAGEAVLTRAQAESWRSGTAGITSADLAALRADVQRLTAVVAAGDRANVQATERVAVGQETAAWREEIRPRLQ